MSEPSIIFDHVSKKFSRSYTADSLRDALIQPFQRLFRREKGQSDKPDDIFWALEDVNFSVRPGEVMGIIGPNGSGKSTSLKLLSRILRPDKGNIVVKGRVGAMIELGAGFNHDLTGKENVFLNGAILGMTKKEIQKRYDAIVEFAEIKEFMDTPVKWYSSGMLARLGFSVAAHIEPRILLVDEVLSVGDLWFQKKCLDKMHEFKKHGTTIVFVSHNMESVASLCSRVAVINRGALQFAGDTVPAISHYMELKKDDFKEDPDKVMIEKAAMYDSSKINSHTYSSGDSISIEMGMKALVDIENINVGIKFFKRGMLISSTNYIALSGQKINIKKNNTLNIVFDMSLNLTSGIYSLMAVVHDEKNNLGLAKVDIAKVVVRENANAEGMAFLNARISRMSIN